MDPIAPYSPRPNMNDENQNPARRGATNPEVGEIVDPLAQPSPGARSALATHGLQQQLEPPSTTWLSDASSALLSLHYSPTKHELDAHPIRQRLSLVRDDICTGLGTAPSPDEVGVVAEQPRQEHPPDTQLPHAMADNEVKEGDQVSWQWSGSRPGGEATEVKDKGEVSITTHRGNEVKKNAEPDNPAVKISRSGNDVVKKASELDVEEPGDKHKEAAGEEKTVTEADKKEGGAANGEAKTGEKRKAADEKKDAAEPKENGEKAPPKKKGRPAKNGGAPKKETKKREPKKAATESGEPRRSGRHASK